MTAWAMRLFYRLAEALLIGAAFAVAIIVPEVISGGFSARDIALVFVSATTANFLAERR